MKASELIKELVRLSAEIGGDPEVLCQAHGCCHHGHSVETIERGAESYQGSPTTDEKDSIVIRV